MPTGTQQQHDSPVTIEIMKNIAIYGFGGFGKEVACILHAINEIASTWNLVGFFDDGVAVGTSNKYGKVLGGLDVLNSYKSDLSVVMAIANPKILVKIIESVSNPHISYPNIIAPTVTFYDKHTVEMGIGNVIVYGSRFSCDIQIGNFNIFNSSSYLGHDISIGNFNILQPETRLSGGVTVGDSNFFGVRSTVVQYTPIGNNTNIGAGSMVLRKTKDGCLYYGNPAKKVEGF